MNEPNIQQKIEEARWEIENGDCKKAYAILQSFIEKKNPEAIFLCSMLSVAEDESEEQFEKRSFKMLNEAAGLGHTPAIFALAVCYESGDLVEQDPLRAAILFKKSAEAGFSKAEFSHGLNLIYGSNGIPKDKTMGLHYLKKAAEKGFEEAENELLKLKDN